MFLPPTHLETDETLAQRTARAAAVLDVAMPLAEAGEPLVALPKARLDAWLADVGALSTCLDARGRSAYLVGYLSWAVARRLAALSLTGGVPTMAASALRIADDPGASHPGTSFAIAFDLPPDAVADSLGMPELARLIEDLHRPLVAALAARAGLGRQALWRLVADSVAGGWLAVGKSIGFADRARLEAEALLKHPGSPLANRQVGFVRIAIEADPVAGTASACEWFRVRGGCCRYYTTPESAGEYCTTCVLRDPVSRDRRLAIYLRDQQAPQA